MSGSNVGLFSRIFREIGAQAGSAGGAAGGAPPGGPLGGPHLAALLGGRGLAAVEAGPEQHLLQGIVTRLDDGVAIVIPPRHHRVVTLRLAGDPDVRRLRSAQRRFEQALAELDRAYSPTPGGLGVTVAWGLPYFRRFVAGPAERLLPVDLMASQIRGERTLAILDAIRFPSDPDDTILEENDLAVLLRSDDPAQIDAAFEALFGPSSRPSADIWSVTSIRNGFIGGEGIGLPKERALAAGIPGADRIPDGAQLFMGFTSSQKAALGSDRIANLEAIPGLTDQWPDGYFRHGTTMHLSHLYEDLAAWYGRFGYGDRVARAFRPGLEVAPGTQTVAEGPSQVESAHDVARDLAAHGTVGHSAALQPATRLVSDVIDNYGSFHPQGSAVPQRADFNTLDNPFAWSADPAADRMAAGPSAGLHFVVFVPVSAGFHRGRLAMDGRYGTDAPLPLDPRSPHHGMNAFLRTTHRQNFLVPPRAHRSFPLAELL